MIADQQIHPPPQPYDSGFALAYASNTCLMIAVSLLFRYADFVKLFGGGEFELGWITGVGTVGALSARIVFGIGIDRFGSKAIWLISMALYVASLIWHTQITTVFTAEVYVARMLLLCGLAGAFGASLTFISLSAPHGRAAEVIGMLGTSGFFGMAIGPWFGDLLFRNGTGATAVANMFWLAVVFGSISLLLVIVIPHPKLDHAERKKKLTTGPRANLLTIVRQYHPGFLLCVAMAMGLGISLPGIFLRPYCFEANIDSLGYFFLFYNLFAFIARMMTRTLPDRMGHKYAILLGLVLSAISMPLYLTVTNEWLLILPALTAGVSHAFLFPSVIASGGLAFPKQNRGLATTLMLACFDCGVLIGAPLVGTILSAAAHWNLPKYQTMFLSVSAILLTTALIFFAAGSSRLKTADTENGNSQPRAE